MYLFQSFSFFPSEDGIRGLVRSRGLGHVYKRHTVISFFLGMGIIAELLRRLAIFRPVVISMGIMAAVAWSYFLVSIIDGLTGLMHYSLPRPVYYTILILAIIRYGYKNFWIALAYVEHVILERYCTQTSDHVG